MGAGAGVEPAARPTVADEYWSALETYQFDRAALALRSWPPGDGARERRFAAAVATLQRQPRTTGSVNDAIRRFESLAEGSDRIAVASLYLAARAHDYHLPRPDRAQAAALYRKLLERHPGDPIAEAAFVSLAVFRLFDPAADAPPELAFNELEALLATLRSTSARRNGHLVLADSALRLRGDRERAVRHLEAVWSLEPRMLKLRTDTLIKLGELLLSLGRKRDAAVWYRRFLELYPEEVRAPWVRTRLAVVEGT